jgi:hypothetical protein
MRFARLSCVASATLLASLLACSATPTNTFTGMSGAGAGAGAGTNGAGAGTTATGPSTTGGLGGGFGVGAGTGTGGSVPGCTVAAELVYVLSTNNQLFSFNPGQKEFSLIGTLGCSPPDPTAQPNSMAVDRTATAWVNYVSTDPISGTDSAGWVYQVSTKDASCASTPAITMPTPQWYRLGMGFSTDAANGSTETFFVAGTGTDQMSNSPGLGKLATQNGALTLLTLGQFSGDATLVGQSAELTGTGAAELFGFFTTTPVRVAQIAKNAAILSDMPVSGVPTPLAWAFSFWGGSFYLYTSADGTTNSTVTKFDPTTKSVDTTYNLTAPAVIDGAGSSTCAPLTQTM